MKIEFIGGITATLDEDIVWHSEDKFIEQALNSITQSMLTRLGPANGDPRYAVFRQIAAGDDVVEAIETPMNEEPDPEGFERVY